MAVCSHLCVQSAHRAEGTAGPERARGQLNGDFVQEEGTALGWRLGTGSPLKIQPSYLILRCLACSVPSSTLVALSLIVTTGDCELCIPAQRHRLPCEQQLAFTSPTAEPKQLEARRKRAGHKEQSSPGLERAEIHLQDRKRPP